MRETIVRLVDECAAHGHEHERLSVGLVRSCVQGDEDDLGVLALAVSVMNMGVDIPIEIPIVDGGVSRRHDLPDPVGTTWKGRPAGHGKHLTDYLQGGLMGPHIDGSSLLDVYAKWGNPGLSADVPSTDYGRIMRSRHADQWKLWAAELVERREVLEWSIEWWLAKYWNHRLVVSAISREARVVRARIANSRPGWLRRIQPHIDPAMQASMYVGAKTDEGLMFDGPARAERNRERAQRQMLHCARVMVLMRHFGGE